MGGEALTMRPFRSLISYEDAKAILLKNTRPVSSTERIKVDDALGRVIADDVNSNIYVPPFHRSAMDGYAVRAKDTFEADKHKPINLKLIDVVFAGHQSKKNLKKGECIEIATGAPLPKGADAVVMVEDTEKDGNRVNIFKPVHPRANVSRMGEDIEKGDVVLRKGDFLAPSRLGVLSALALTDVTVFKQPEIAIIPTGSEIQEPDKKLKKGQVYDINSYTLISLAKENCCKPVKYDIVKDDKKSLRNTLQNALKCDGVVISGGSSVGTKDILSDVLAELGEILFHGVQIKPGKPILCAKVENKIVLGIPGYPASCLTNGYLLLVPYLRRLSQLPEKFIQKIKMPLAKRVVSRLGRHEFLTIKLSEGAVIPVFKGSGAITSLAYADGYIEIPINVDLIEKGEIVEVKFF